MNNILNTSEEDVRKTVGFFVPSGKIKTNVLYKEFRHESLLPMQSPFTNIRYLSFLMTLCLLSLYKLCEKRRFSKEGGDDCKDVVQKASTSARNGNSVVGNLFLALV